MELPTQSVVLFIVLSSVLQVVEADTVTYVGASISAMAFIIFLSLVLFRYYANSKKRQVEPRDGDKQVVVVRKVIIETQHHPQPTGQHHYPGTMAHQPQNYPAPPMHSDPAYPPPMPAAQSGPPNHNPFTSAAYGH